MISDFRPVIAMLKSMNIMNNLRVAVEELSLPESLSGETSKDILSLIIYNTDRKFLPIPKSSKAACEVIKLHQLGKTDEFLKMHDIIDKSLRTLDAKSSCRTDDDIVDFSLSIVMLDDVMDYYKSGIWRGTDYNILSLKAKYLGRELWLAGKREEAIKVLNRMPESVKQSEIENFYSLNGW